MRKSLIAFGVCCLLSIVCTLSAAFAPSTETVADCTGAMLDSAHNSVANVLDLIPVLENEDGSEFALFGRRRAGARFVFVKRSACNGNVQRTRIVRRGCSNCSTQRNTSLRSGSACNGDTCSLPPQRTFRCPPGCDCSYCQSKTQPPLLEKSQIDVKYDESGNIIDANGKVQELHDRSTLKPMLNPNEPLSPMFE